MVDCGSQVTICDMPIHFDNYVGCSHACEYCFVKRKGKDISKIKPKIGSYNSLKGFIEGKRQVNTNWCDWDIPIHWGAMSDPFQPIEAVNKENKDSTLNILCLLAETKYPIVISTKGKLCIEGEYLEVLKDCNVVMQVSCVSSYYDNIEKGAPCYKDRVRMIEVLSKNVKRVIVRCQPYMPQVKNDILRNSLNDFANAGAYGVIFEGMKYTKNPKNIKFDLQRVGNDLCFDKRLLSQHFELFKNKTHNLGMKFFVGENRLRTMGDSLCCCGVADLFKVNTYNCNHLLNGDKTKPTELMKQVGTGKVAHALDQSVGTYERQKTLTFEKFIQEQCNKQTVQKALGIKSN